ncbi:MAG: helix-turn-helix domain-containing protein [PVC group bacterium]
MIDEKNIVEDSQWMPLKEAARLLGCSVKTIRRRIKTGAWRSTIEYQGQKAIRLVSREDVLSESTAVQKSFSGQLENAIATGALEGVHHHLGDLLKAHLTGLAREMDAVSRRSRMYLFISLGVTAILLTLIVVFLVTEQGRITEKRVLDTKNALSTMIVHNQEISGLRMKQLSEESAASFRLANETGNRIEQNRQLLDGITSTLRTILSESAAGKAARESSLSEIDALRQQVTLLQEEIMALRPTTDASKTPLPPEGTPPGPGQEFKNPLPQEEKKESGFLGIF